MGADDVLFYSLANHIYLPNTGSPALEASDEQITTDVDVSFFQVDELCGARTAEGKAATQQTM